MMGKLSYRAGEIAIYARVSKEESAKEEEGSLKSQVQRCLEWLNGKGADATLETVRLYSEGGSGKDTNRREYKRLMRDVRRGTVKLIVIAELSRISRSLFDFLHMSTEWAERGVGYASVRESFIDSTSPHGKMLVRLMMLLYEFEREQTALRTKLNMRARAKRGLFNGGKVAIGYKADPVRKGYLKVDDDYASIVVEAFAMYLQHGGPGPVSRLLNERGLLRPDGKPFDWQTIHTMLANPTYLGRKEVNRKNRNLAPDAAALLPEEDRYFTVDAVWPAIIEQETWDRVGLLREANKRHRNATQPAMHHDYVLTGVVRCRSCGTTLEGGGAKGQKYHYYRHPKRTKQADCPQGSYQAEAVEEAVLNRLQGYVDNDTLLDSIVAEANEDIITGADLLRDQVGEAERRVRTAAKERDHIFENLMSAPKDSVPSSFWAKAKAKETEVKVAEQEVLRLKSAVAEAEATEIGVEAHREALRQFNDAYEHLNPHEKRKLLGHFLDAVELDGDKFYLSLFGEEPEVRGLPKKEKGCGNKYRTPSSWLRGQDSNL